MVDHSATCISLVHFSLKTMSLAFALEKQVAVSAVLRACTLTTSIFNKLVKDEKLTKDDKSPVTGSYDA